MADVIRMISISHWGMIDVLGPLSFEGPAYADRVHGRLTFRDWAHWEPDDQLKYSGEFLKRAPKPVIFEFQKSLGLIDGRFN